MDKNNNRMFISHIITVILAVFTAINGALITKLNAKARADNENSSDANHVNRDPRTHQATLVPTGSSQNLSLDNAGQTRSISMSLTHQDHYYDKAINSITSNIIKHALQSSAAKSADDIESSVVTSNAVRQHTVRSSFTSISNYYDRRSDITTGSSVAQPKYYNRGRSSGIDKLAIQNQYPAEYQSLSNVYQTASVTLASDRSRASNAYQYAAEYRSLDDQRHREAFSWHTESNAVNPQTYQDYLNRQYQSLSSSANYISEVSNGLNRVNRLFQQIHKFDHNPLYRGLVNLRMNKDAKSLTAVNQRLADNNQELINVNNPRERLVYIKLSSLEAKNRSLTAKENDLLNRWKLDSFLTSKTAEPLSISRFYKRYLNKLIRINNYIYHDTFGMKVYGFAPTMNRYRLLTEKAVGSGKRMRFNTHDLNVIKQTIDQIYGSVGQIDKDKALFHANDVVLPKSIFDFLKAHHYRLANGQSIERNLILGSVQIKKHNGDLNLFIKFHHCNSLTDLNRLSGYNGVIEMVPVLHGYYPLGNRVITNVINEMLRTSHQSSLKDYVRTASGAVNGLIHKYQASLSDFMSCSGLDKELASANYFAHSYSSVVKSDEGNLSLASVELDNFYINHARPESGSLRNQSNNYSTSYYQRWHHIPKYIHVNKGLPIYTIAHRLIGVTKDNVLRVTGIGLDHSGQLLYKVSNQRPLGYISADERFIRNAYYSTKDHVLAEVKKPTNVYRDAKLTVPFKRLSANSRITGKIVLPNHIGSEKTIFKTNNENYLSADVQSLKVIKNLKN